MNRGKEVGKPTSIGRPLQVKDDVIVSGHLGALLAGGCIPQAHGAHIKAEICRGQHVGSERVKGQRADSSVGAAQRLLGLGDVGCQTARRHVEHLDLMMQNTKQNKMQKQFCKNISNAW